MCGQIKNKYIYHFVKLFNFVNSCKCGATHLEKNNCTKTLIKYYFYCANLKIVLCHTLWKGPELVNEPFIYLS